MVNLKLEELRTKEELIKYFKQLGKNITEEEIETLKKQFEPYAKDESTLTMQQLNEVAGGLLLFHIKAEHLGENGEHKEAIIKKINDKRNSRICAFEHEGNLIIACDDGKKQVAINYAQVKAKEGSQFDLKMANGEGNPEIRIKLDELLSNPKKVITDEGLKFVYVAFRSNKDTVPITEDWKPYMQAVSKGIEDHLNNLRGEDSLDTMINKIPGLKQLREGLKNSDSCNSMPSCSYLDFTKSSRGTWHGSPKGSDSIVSEPSDLSLPPVPQSNPDGSSTENPLSLAQQSNPTGTVDTKTDMVQIPGNSFGPSSSPKAPQSMPTEKSTDHPHGTPSLPTVPAPEVPEDSGEGPKSPDSSHSHTPTPPSSPAPVALDATKNSAQATLNLGSGQPKTPLQSGAEKQEQQLIQDKEPGKREEKNLGSDKSPNILEVLNRIGDAAKETLEEQQKSDDKKVKEQKRDRVIITNLYILGFVAIALYMFAELDKKDFNKGISEISKIFNKIFGKDKNSKKIK